MTDVPEFLSTWIQGQRWFAGKGRTPRWERIGGFSLPATDDTTEVTVHLLLDSAEPPILYQVPLTSHPVPLGGQELALVGQHDGRFVYDGTRDPVGASAILRLILDDGAARPDDGGPGLAARGHSSPDAPALEIVRSRVLAGEQSNTSIIFDVETLDGEAATPVICKVFRSLHHGENPDVTLTAAISATGSTVVPHSVGHVTGQWRDTGEPTGWAHGHLAFAQEFLPGVEDAWRVALKAASAQEDFADAARALGAATADIHLALASGLPTRTASENDIAAMLVSMRQRLDSAITAAPVVEQYRGAVERLYDSAESATWPALQRIHGDYHLGQVLSVPGRGWVALDFEGEPLRPMSERAVADSPLRDVAGMLRSFDYVAGSIAQSDAEASGPASVWASAARDAFVDGYAHRSGVDLSVNQMLVDAFEVDKALYEVVYEARNRPAWLSIPLDAIGRLVERVHAD